MLPVRLKSVRKRKKLTQEELAKRVNTTKATISNYENGHSTPSNDMLLLLADALDTSTDYLLGREDKTPETDKAEAEFEAWLDDPTIDKFYREFKESPKERKEALLAVWEIIKKTNR